MRAPAQIPERRGPHSPSENTRSTVRTSSASSLPRAEFCQNCCCTPANAMMRPRQLSFSEWTQRLSWRGSLLGYVGPYPEQNTTAHVSTSGDHGAMCSWSTCIFPRIQDRDYRPRGAKQLRAKAHCAEPADSRLENVRLSQKRDRTRHRRQQHEMKSGSGPHSCVHPPLIP